MPKLRLKFNLKLKRRQKWNQRPKLKLRTRPLLTLKLNRRAKQSLRSNLKLNKKLRAKSNQNNKQRVKHPFSKRPCPLSSLKPSQNPRKIPSTMVTVSSMLARLTSLTARSTRKSFREE